MKGEKAKEHKKKERERNTLKEKEEGREGKGPSMENRNKGNER